MSDRHAVLRYLAVASLVRSADGAAAVGLISLAQRVGSGAGTGGLLAALLTAPHLLGPWLARPLDRSRDDRRVLSLAFATFGAALGAAAVTLGPSPVLVPALSVALAGMCGPLMTGGLSSKLAPLVGPTEAGLRRAEGWDATTYGLGTTLGPAAVAALAATAGPQAALLCLAGAAGLGAVLVWTLPQGRSRRAAALPVLECLRAIGRIGQLRRTLVATTLTAMATGGFAVVAVLLGEQLRHSLSGGAVLNAAYGLGGLVGGAGVAALPMRGEPERRLIRLVGLSAVAIACCAAAPTYPAALVAFTIAGVAGAVLFTASLAVRSTYSPDGARAQVFVTMAGLKMAGASAGTALAGALAGWGPRVLLAAAASLVAVAALVAAADRHRSRSAHPQQRGIEGEARAEGQRDRALTGGHGPGHPLEDQQHRG